MPHKISADKKWLLRFQSCLFRVAFPSQNIRKSAVWCRAVEIVGENTVLLIYTKHSNNCLYTKNMTLSGINTPTAASVKCCVIYLFFRFEQIFVLPSSELLTACVSIKSVIGLHILIHSR